MKKRGLIKVLQVVIIMSLVLVFYGCGAQKSAKSESTQNTTSAMDQKVETEEVAPEAPMADLATGEAATNGETPKVSTKVDYNRKMIKTGELYLQTKEFKKSVEGIVDKVQELGGYIENSQIQGNNLYNNNADRKSASMTLRLPQKHFDSFMNESSQFGNVVDTRSGVDDITSAYVDTEIRLKALKVRHERLLALLEQSGSLKDLFAIEQELGDVTYEIEKLSGTLQEYDQLVDMSTIHIQIEEVYKIEENRPVITFGDKIASTFMRSVEGLKAFTQGLILILIGIVPFLIIIVPLGLIGIWIAKKSKIKYDNKRKKESEKD
jgi:flagellar basal body-associated protein FliL